ncbi:MAG: DUF1080 domain-containing protein [bacterium]|nr:DUF1080 domain-containing protein [bacterium]
MKTAVKYSYFSLTSIYKLLCSLISMLVILVIGCSAITGNNEPWIDLFNGEDLTGWSQKNGNASYTVEKGELVGTTVLNTPNSFLCTDEEYSDFILELEFIVDPILNSGVQIRSHSYPEYNNFRVHGYQIEIDPSDRAWCGGIYDEARRGWLYPLEEDETAQKAFKQGEWNKFRIEAIGNHLKVWVNDIPTAHLVDDMSPSGFFGLQVHGIGKDKSKENIKVIWRNIRIITESPEKYQKEMELPPKDKFNKLTSNEIGSEWKLLFDGKTSAGWRSAKSDNFPEAGWEIDNGELTVLASGGDESANGGDIITMDKYSNFELQVDFKITEAANSGIKYFVLAELNKGAGSAIGLEYQILDDERHPDAKLGNHEGSRTLASLYDLIKAENKYPRQIGEWNHARIISRNNHVEHWLNGRKVLEYERGSDEYRQLVGESKYKIWNNFGEASEGHILLQDHGDRVSFRNIKIRVLPN